jgi:hypothetical protein
MMSRNGPSASRNYSGAYRGTNRARPESRPTQGRDQEAKGGIDRSVPCAGIGATRKLVGVAGFEPATPSSRTRCATSHPPISLVRPHVAPRQPPRAAPQEATLTTVFSPRAIVLRHLDGYEPLFIMATPVFNKPKGAAAEARPSPYAKLQQANAELQIELHDGSV